MTSARRHAQCRTLAMRSRLQCGCAATAIGLRKKRDERGAPRRTCFGQATRIRAAAPREQSVAHAPDGVRARAAFSA
ncbi:hypothetical protein BDSB_08655 [Burkholderia dolosa PC543]|nr:hypothetical protein BDSB_08655 [Burkholderia dolosa PC543]